MDCEDLIACFDKFMKYSNMKYEDFYGCVLDNGSKISTKKEAIVRILSVINLMPVHYKERIIIKFGLGGDNPKTYEETAKIFGETVDVLKGKIHRGSSLLHHPAYSRLLYQGITSENLEKLDQFEKEIVEHREKRNEAEVSTMQRYMAKHPEEAKKTIEETLKK